MYFASDDESIIEVIKTEIYGIAFEIQITHTFFAYENDVYAKKHNHAHYEVFLNKTCSGEMLIENERLEFCAGSMIIIAPKVYHSFRPEPLSQKCKEKYNLKFIFLPSDDTRDIINDVLFSYTKDANEIIDIVEKIHSIYENVDFASKDERQSYFRILLIEILRTITKRDEAIKEEKQQSQEYDSQIGEIESFFEAHYDSFPPPLKLAAQLNVSARHLDRILKQLFSMSFSAKLAQTKTELAKDLLTSTDFSIVRISDKLGYNSPASFSAAFKKKVGQPPNIYRKNNK